MSPETPLHVPAGGGVAWTRGNLGEALPGRCTPLSWTFFGPATEAGIRGGFHRIGALSQAELAPPAAVGERFATVIYGWAAANIDLMAHMAERLPGVEPAQVERELFGEVRDVQRHPTRRRYPLVAARMPVALAGSLRQVRAARADVETWWRSAIAVTTPEAARRVLREAGQRFSEHMLLHTIISMAASGARDAIVALAGDTVDPARLITGYGTVEETRVADDLWAVSRAELPLDVFLARHGWHGIHNGQLHKRVWREQPDAVRRLAARYADLPDDRRPAARARHQGAERETAEAELLGRLRGAQRARARAVLAIGRRFIAHREIGKAGYLIATDGARAAARRLGEASGIGEDVFLLTVDELLAGAGTPALIAERREQQTAFAALSLPDAWVGTPEPVGEVPPPSTGPLAGIGVCAGIVEGRARVVHDPDDDFEAGEILVCATTDPSWVSLFVAAAAVVIDIGGHLSHGAIVARELGIPCIVNTRDGTRRIASGDTLRIDGRSGTVQILQPITEDATA